MNVVLAVAEVAAVAERAAAALALVAGRTGAAVGLLHGTECGADVFEFVVDVEGDFRKTDDETEDGDGRNQDEFGGDDETGFVAIQLADEVRHVCLPGRGIEGSCDGRPVKQGECQTALGVQDS